MLDDKSPNLQKKNPQILSSTLLSKYSWFYLAFSLDFTGNRENILLRNEQGSNYLKSRVVCFWTQLAGDVLWTCTSHPLPS